jgi:hypothetical protein
LLQCRCGSSASGTGDWLFPDSSGYATVSIDSSSGVGLLIKDSFVNIKDGSVSDNASHGIEVLNSRVLLESVGGSGNGGAGVYAHSGSIVHITDGSPPTLTGTVGDLAVSDPAVEESTWAAIDGGDPVQIAAESTVVKEV